MLAKRKSLASDKIDNFLSSSPTTAFETEIITKILKKTSKILSIKNFLNKNLFIQPGSRNDFIVSLNAEDELQKAELERTRIQQLKYAESKENEAPSHGSDSEYLASEFNSSEKMLKQREKRPRQALQPK